MPARCPRRKPRPFTLANFHDEVKAMFPAVTWSSFRKEMPEAVGFVTVFTARGTHDTGWIYVHWEAEQVEPWQIHIGRSGADIDLARGRSLDGAREAAWLLLQPLADVVAPRAPEAA